MRSAGLLALFCLLGGGCFSVPDVLVSLTSDQENVAAGENQPAAKAAPGRTSPLTVSPETTVLTEPVREDGRVDFVVAVNRQWLEKVPTDRNALVPLLGACSPEITEHPATDEILQQLGLRSLDVVSTPFRAATGALEEPLQHALGNPWRRRDDPQLAAWLDRNAVALERVAEASRLPQWFHPIVDPVYEAEDGLVIEGIAVAVFPGHNEFRQISRAFAARAMLRFEEGDDAESGIEDLITIHRLARLIAQGCFPVEFLVAKSIEAVAVEAVFALLQQEKLDAAAAARLQKEMNRLSASPDALADQVRTEHFGTLDILYYFGVDHPNAAKHYMQLMYPGPPRDLASPWDHNPMASLIDWDSAAKRCLEWTDQRSRIFSAPDPRWQRQAAHDYDSRLSEAGAAALDAGKVREISQRLMAGARNRTEDSTQAASEAGRSYADVVMGPSIMLNYALVNARHRGIALVDLMRTALVLESYRERHGRFPDRLKDLVPKNPASLPRDPFSDEPFQYRRQGNGYVLYSLGINEIDDGGPHPDQHQSDDIGLTVRR